MCLGLRPRFKHPLRQVNLHIHTTFTTSTHHTYTFSYFSHQFTSYSTPFYTLYL
nr:MAG TPA: hypothetical protein [Caudoviricetes sp.]